MFYSNEHDPIHIHVVKGDMRAKFTLFPVKLVSSHGLKAAELSFLKEIVEDNREFIAGKWNEYFNSNEG